LNVYETTYNKVGNSPQEQKQRFISETHKRSYKIRIKNTEEEEEDMNSVKVP